ncbi:MAG: short-chain dehydrogenase [Thermoleophilia bacterium]|jgi:NAD(P)-dependent dehydrogenase (short-subunit alcohol dehydrogenase family)|nr:MAG: short-chain dehydrogenase [Thermoleophilia bacterium]
MTAERRLEGRVALITGAASGNGRAIALRYAAEGAAVVCADLVPNPIAGGWEDSTTTHDLINAEGGRATFVECDVTDGAQVAAAVATATDTYGGLDITIANAGISPMAYSIVDEPFEDYKQVQAVNQDGVWWTCRESARAMIEQGRGGRIVTLASIAGITGVQTGYHYNMSKGAVVQITRTLAIELAPHSITVNAICPGYVRTSMTRNLWDDPAKLARLQATTPMPRLGEAEDIAGAAFFLASDDAAWMTGVIMPVDGGFSAI